MKMSEKTEIVTKKLGIKGSIITSSKGRYRYNNPNNIVVFNANIVSNKKVIWHGDIDISVDYKKLINIGKEIGKYYIIHEMDGRFEKASKPDTTNFVAMVDGNGIILDHKHEYKYVNGAAFYAPEKNVEPKTSPSPYEKEAKKFTDVDFPHLKTFKTRSKKISPLTLMHQYIIDTCGGDIDKAQKIYDSMYFTKSLDKEFENIMRSYFKNVYKMDGYDLEREMNWLVLSTPGNLASYGLNPSWAVDGKVYIKK
jgi:hypothetical protein